MAEKDKDIVARAQRRFNECESWEGTARQRFKDDIRFLFADSDNQDQWDANVKARRQIDGKPMVTINKTHTHYLHVVNDIKENPPQIKVQATGGGASYQSAQVYGAVIKHIENISRASDVYKHAASMQVGGGIGYMRLTTEYADDSSFDQEIFIRQVQDSNSVYLDPFIKQFDGSDARFGFVYEDMPTEKFEKKYPNIPLVARDMTSKGWVTRDSVRIAQYYEVEERREWLYAIEDDNGETQFVRESDVEPGVRKMWADAFKMGAPNIQRRRVDKKVVRSYVIAGNEIAEKGTWAGSYIPIIRVVGEEVVIDGKLDRKGLTRYLKDAQRAYNYNTSAQLEFGALQGKIPWKAPVEAIEGLENYWATANTANHAYLPYNHADENGNPIPEPTRQDPPNAAPAYLVGMQAAAQEMMMASGQYEATFSEQGNEISGVALNGRKKQGERATLHFRDHLDASVRFLGVQLIDLIPRIYDTKRVILIEAEGGTQHTITIDPEAKQAVQQDVDESENTIASVFNPNVGKYSIVASSGPSYDTMRQEGFESMTQLLAGNPALAQVIGDLYMGAADFPEADKLQERMRNWIPKNILGEGPTPEEEQLTQQVQQLTQVVQVLQTELQNRDTQHALQKQRNDMDALNHLALRMENDNKTILEAFKAETARLEKLLPIMAPDALDMVVRKALEEILTAQNPDANVKADPADPANTYAEGMASVLGEPTAVVVTPPEQMAVPQPQETIPQQ